MTVQELTIPEGFVLDSETGCWLYADEKAILPNGYARRHSPEQGKSVYVHREMYERENGPIPVGMTIDHVFERGCRHKHCGNPAHLEAVTLRVNIQRRFGKDGLEDACGKGHPYTEENTLVRMSKGKKARACKTCQKQYRRDAYLRNGR